MTRCKKPCTFNDCGRACVGPKHHSVKRWAHACCTAHQIPVNRAPSGISAAPKPDPATSFGPPLRWTQFGTETLLRLRDARLALAKAGGLAQADGMKTWAERAMTLATLVQDLVNEIERNAERALQDACR